MPRGDAQPGPGQDMRGYTVEELYEQRDTVPATATEQLDREIANRAAAWHARIQ